MAQRSIAGQVEFLSLLGKSIEPVLRRDRALALRRSGAARAFSEIIASVDTDAGREKVHTHLQPRPFPNFEACPEDSGMLVKIAEDGSRGRFVIRVFVEAK